MALNNLNKILKEAAQDAKVVGAGAEGEQSAAKPSSDTSAVARTGLWVLGLGFGGFLLWAALAPLDEGVPTQGMVTLDTKRKTVQHLSGGIVKEVLVHEGQQV
jgi:protease secretion system membrane fusion protein